MNWLVGTGGLLTALYLFLVARGRVPADPYGRSYPRAARYGQSFACLTIAVIAFGNGFGWW